MFYYYQNLVNREFLDRKYLFLTFSLNLFVHYIFLKWYLMKGINWVERALLDVEGNFILCTKWENGLSDGTGLN